MSKLLLAIVVAAIVFVVLFVILGVTLWVSILAAAGGFVLGWIGDAVGRRQAPAH
jgi:uncharacterized protein YqfA (UPF0365 family)